MTPIALDHRLRASVRMNAQSDLEQAAADVKYVRYSEAIRLTERALKAIRGLWAEAGMNAVWCPECEQESTAEITAEGKQCADCGAALDDVRF